MTQRYNDNNYALTVGQRVRDLERKVDEDFGVRGLRGANQTANQIPYLPGGIVFGGGATVNVYAPNIIGVYPTPDDPTTGANFDGAYIDWSWTAITTYGEDQITEYECELTESGGSPQYIRVVGTSIRFDLLRSNVSYSMRVRAYSKLNQVSAWSSPTKTITSGTDTTAPSAPAAVTAVYAASGSIIIRYTEAGMPADVLNGNGKFEFQIATNSGFTTGVQTVTMRSQTPALAGATAATNCLTGFGQLTGGPFYLRHRAIDSAGNAGSYTTYASNPISLGTSYPAYDSTDRVIVSNNLVAFDLQAVNATFMSASISSAFINDLSASKITAGTIGAYTITLLNSSSSILKSGNYSSGSAGWAIDGAGNAEFNTVTVRGSMYVSSTNYFNSSGLTLNSTADVSSPEIVSNANALRFHNGTTARSGIWSWDTSGMGFYNANDTYYFYGSPGIYSAAARVVMKYYGSGDYWGLWLNYGNSKQGGGDYSILGGNSGDTYVNASSGKTVVIRVNNGDIINASSSEINTNDVPVRYRGPGDGNHSTWYNSGFNGVEIDGYAKVRIVTTQVSHSFDFDTDGWARSDNGWTTFSSRSIKTDIKPYEGSLEKLLKLQPVTFRHNDDLRLLQAHAETRSRFLEGDELVLPDSLPASPTMLGFIAEDVQEVDPLLVVPGDVLSLDYSKFAVLSVGAIQELTKRIERLELLTNG